MDDNPSNLLLWQEIEDHPLRYVTVDHNRMFRRAEASGALNGDDWLLAYEARVRGWCKSERWSKMSHWREVKEAGVRFLESSPRPRRLTRLTPSFWRRHGSV